MVSARSAWVESAEMEGGERYARRPQEAGKEKRARSVFHAHVEFIMAMRRLVSTKPAT